MSRTSRPHHLIQEGPTTGVHVRVGSTNRRADAELIEELRRFARGEGFDEQPLPGHDSEALDFRAASESFAPFRKLARRDLETLRLVTDHQGRKVPTVGGMILFGIDRQRHFPDAWIQAGRFAGTDRSHIADRTEIRSLPAHVAPLTQAGHLPVMGFTGPNFNHSVAGVTTRWLIFERVWKDGDFTIAYRSTPARLVTLRVIVYATMALLVIVVVAVVRRLPRGRSPAGEFALVLLLMPLLSPVSSKPHFAVLLLPGFFLARAAVEQTERWPRVLLAAAIAAGLVSNKDLVGGFVYDNVIWRGSVLWNTIFVLAGCVVVLWRSTERERIDGCARLRGGRAGRNNRTAR